MRNEVSLFAKSQVSKLSGNSTVDKSILETSNSIGGS